MNIVSCMSKSEFTAGAAAAAMQVARDLGIERADAVVLYASQHISVRLLPAGLVARIVPDNTHSVNKLRCELVVARFLAARGAPVVRVTSDIPSGPHFVDKFAMTFWEFVTHTPAQENNAEHTTRAAAALCRVHQALADFPGELPNFWAKVDQCRGLLRTQSALPALAPNDRRFLLQVCDRLQTSLDRMPLRFARIHGDAHLGNVFITSDGALWNDFEDVCLGPREWDIGWLPEAELAAFEPLNRGALVVLGYLRSLCVSVWCWDLADIPEKREAAEYHLSYLRGQALAGRI